MMKNRVEGVIGIGAKMCNFNADFTGRPRTTTEGDIFASDKALKYCIRKFWDNQDELVFAMRTLNEDLVPRTLSERYESLFGEIDKNKSAAEVLNNLFTCIDISNFGIAFAEKGHNLSVTGAVQIGQGVNLYEDTHIETMDILSPYRNPNEKKGGGVRNQTTIGEMVIADEAHYFYPFTVNPLNYKEFEEVNGFKGYTKEDYNKLKEALRLSVTAFNTNTRKGADNEFAMFIEFKESSKSYISNLVDFIKFDIADENKKIIDITKLNFIDDIIDEIDSIEIYYNPHTIDVKDEFKNTKVKRFNIFTAKEIKG